MLRLKYEAVDISKAIISNLIGVKIPIDIGLLVGQDQQVLEDLLKQAAPVDTGALKKSITVSDEKPFDDKIERIDIRWLDDSYNVYMLYYGKYVKDGSMYKKNDFIETAVARFNIRKL